MNDPTRLNLGKMKQGVGRGTPQGIALKHSGWRRRDSSSAAYSCTALKYGIHTGMIGDHLSISYVRVVHTSSLTILSSYLPRQLTLEADGLLSSAQRGSQVIDAS